MPEPAKASFPTRVSDRDVVPVDLQTDGLLWLINATVFHPRGFALAYNPETRTFGLTGDGLEPWSYADPVDTNFKAAEDLFSFARHRAKVIKAMDERRHKAAAHSTIVFTADFNPSSPSLWRRLRDGRFHR